MWRQPRHSTQGGWWASWTAGWRRLHAGRHTLPEPPSPEAAAAGASSWNVPDDDLGADPSSGGVQATPARSPSGGDSEHNVGACARRLRCLVRVAEYVWRYDHIDTLLRDVAAMVPFGFEHAERAHAEICWDGHSYLSDGFERGRWTVRRDLVVQGQVRGAVEVSYAEPDPGRDDASFLKEEHDLVEAISHVLAVGIERRKATESLGEAEQKFLNLFNNAHNGVLLIERHTKRCCLANPVFCQMFGYAADEINELQLSDIQPPQDGGPQIDPLYDPLIGQHALRQDVSLHRKDGSLFYADVSSFPIMVGDKDYWLDIFKDVTERSRATARQEKALEELLRSNRELNDFVVLVSHDLKAVRRGMNLLGHWAVGDLPEPSDAEIRAQTALLVERVERLDDLVTVMAKYSKIGQGDEQETVVPLDEVMGDLVDRMGMPERISVQVGQELPVVRGRRTAIVDILTCLLDNAQRQIDQAEGVIRIGCAEEGRFWKLSVTDTGPGIPSQYHQGLFRLFQATPNGHWEDFGAALATAKRSVEVCGGRIWVESAQGQGSSFFFTLPRIQSREAALVNG
jgi:PAS domain S-box-containing protein